LASVRDIRRQIASIKNISKMTDALQTVSGVKFRKAEAAVKRSRPYAENFGEMMQAVAASSGSKNPLLAGRDEVNAVAVATLTSDRGLCGAFNAQVIRRTMDFRRRQSVPVRQVVSGRKGIAFFRFRRIELDEAFSGFTDSPGFENAQEIGQTLTGLFESGEVDEVYLVYNRFQSALVQRPVLMRLLPAAPEEEEESEDGDEGPGTPFEFVPDADVILGKLIPRYVETQVFQALLESAAGEHGARMTAMKNATDNANELVETLTLQMNKARQAQITREISEIAAGAEALTAG
jgi:F-type H+-transporting ATPase subunit gamma